MIKTLIQPCEVIELAFNLEDNCIAEHISLANILSTETKFIEPVFLDLYIQMLDGQHEEFNKYYIKPALALYIKATILPFAGIIQGPLGISYAATHKGLDLDEERINQLCKLILSDAKTLTERAISYIKAHPEEFADSVDISKISLPKFAGGLIL